MQLPGLFLNPKIVIKTFTAFTYCENIGWSSMERREVQDLNMLMFHNQTETLMTIAW